MSTASRFTINRLREKIDGYIELLDKVRNQNDPDNVDDSKIIETLRPLICVHWMKRLGMAPEEGWKATCIEISKIDKTRDKAKNAAKTQELKMALQQQEDNDRKAAEALVAEMEKADQTSAAEAAVTAAAFLANRFTMDDDQQADLFLFEDTDDEERPESPCLLRRQSQGK